jgi:hypothetical protein
MYYVEHENLIWRRQAKGVGNFPMQEVLNAGKWAPARGESAMEAAQMGTEMSEEQAKEFAGDEWPAEQAAEEPAEAH